MNGHLLRNIGLHSYNKNDPDFRKNKLESYLNNLKNDKLDIKTYCYKLNSCLSYNLNYFLYRIISTFIYSKSYTGKIIGENLKKIFFNNNKMVSHSINLSNLLEKYISSIYPNSKIIIYVEDISYKKSKEPYKYLKKNIQKDKITSFYSSEIKKNKNIIVVRTTEVPKIKDCLELYIPYEGHPSKCQNKKISEYILNLN